MLISRIEIKNFRCIKEETLECDRLTVLVGRNGAGKSTFLQAIGSFFDTSATFTEEDFFNRNVDTTIEIRIAFDSLQRSELEEFSPYVHDNRLIVTKRVSYEDGSTVARYYAAQKQLSEFAEIRSIAGKMDRRTRWNEFVSTGAIQGLERARGTDEIEQMMQAYERAHQDSLVLVEKEMQFFGAKNIGGGKLDKFTKYVLVPAVHEVTEETASKRGAIEQLLEMVVLRKVDNRGDIQAFKAEFEQRARELYSTDNLAEIGELSTDISTILEIFAPGSKLNLRWAEFEPPELSPPSAIATLVEDGFEGDISLKGHGLQRALVLTLLRYLAAAQVASTVDESESGMVQPPREGEEPIEGPDLILAIEEPELYLHPSRCRYLSSILLSLCQDESAGSRAKTQIIYTSHSPYFVDLQRFDQIRLVRKEKPELGTALTRVKSFSVGEACSKLAEICELQPECFTRSSFMAHAAPVMNVIVNEGFFSEAVVVVEGPSDVGVLWKIQELLRLDWDALGVVIVPAGGKNNIDRPTVIFGGLGIPVYFVFDADKHLRGRSNESSTIPKNRRYQRMAGAEPIDYPQTQVNDTWAVFEEEMEATIKADLGADVFEELRNQTALELGYDDASRVMKNIEGSARFVEMVYEKGHRLATLEDIVQRVTKMSRSRMVGFNTE